MLFRSAKIVRTLVHDEHFPIYKIILCPFSYVNYDDTPMDTQVVDKRVYEEWLDKCAALIRQLSLHSFVCFKIY